MKVLLAAAMTLQIGTSFAVTTSLFNALNEDVTDSSGTLLANGSAVAAIGYFTVSDANIVDFSTFVQVGSADPYVEFDPVFDGLFHQTNNTIDMDFVGLDSGAIGQGVYLVIGDNTTDITLSSNWLVYNTGDTYVGGATPGPSTIELSSGSGTLLHGDLGAFKGFDGVTDAFSLTAVPEPSSLSLLGLGAVALVFRRRK